MHFPGFPLGHLCGAFFRSIFYKNPLLACGSRVWSLFRWTWMFLRYTAHCCCLFLLQTSHFSCALFVPSFHVSMHMLIPPAFVPIILSACSFSCVQLLAILLDCSLTGSSVHGIFLTRILERVAIYSSRRSFQPRDQTCGFYVGRQILYHWATWEHPL